VENFTLSTHSPDYAYGVFWPDGSKRVAVMNQAADPQREAPTCKCEVCGENMKLLGNLPDTQSFAAARVFRCYGCNNVTSEQW
jgi:hypothetical protein